MEFNAPTIKPNNKDVGEAVSNEEGVIKDATFEIFKPNINFTVGRVEQPHEGIGNAKATKARGRSKTTKILPQVTTQTMQRQKGANANVEKQPTQPFGPKRKGSLLKQDEIEGLGKKRRMEMETETLCDVMVT